MSDPKTTFTRRRKFAISMNVLVASLLAPLVGGLLIYLAFRPAMRRRLDLTARQSFTLSERTLKVLAGIEEPVDVFTCFRPSSYNEANNLIPGLDAVIGTIALHCNDLLREFELRSGGKVRLHAYDPNQSGHLTRVSELSSSIGEYAINMAVVAKGDRRRVLRLADLAAYDAGAHASQQLRRATLQGFRDEESLVQALLNVTEKHEMRIGFLRGHGECSPKAAGIDPSGAVGLSRFGLALSGQNYTLVEVDLSSGTPLRKQDVDVLVVAEPRKPLPTTEVESVLRYAKEGGRLLVLLSPAAANSLDFPLLDQLFGLARTPDPVCQVTTIDGWTSPANIFFTTAYSRSHPIVRPLASKGLRLRWEEVCELRPLTRPEVTDLVIEQLVASDPESWVDREGSDQKRNHAFDPGSEEKNGNYGLAYAIERKSDGCRAVVVGTAGVIDDNNLPVGTGNRDFGLNIVDWLTSREQLISIAARPFDSVQVDLTQKEFRTIFLYVVAGIPGLALLLGVAVFWARRS